MNNEQTAELLNDLLETCRDGEYGFRAAGEHTESAELKRVFAEAARGCSQAAAELELLVRQRGVQPEAGGSVLGALHRGWVAVRGSLTGADDKAILEECERGEDAAVTHYRKALNEPALSTAVQAVIERQLDGARRRHDQIRHLRDRWSGIVAAR